MAWKETCVMSERIKMISAHEGGDYAISELAAQFGVSRKTVYKWIGRHEAGGWAALADQSRAPRHHPNAVAPAVERALLELKAQRPLWGAPKLRRKLELAFGTERCPAESTVSAILRRHGLSRMARRRRRATPSAQPFAACQEANAVWCADFKGWFRTGDGGKCTPLTISDGHSRYLLRCQGLDGSTGFTTVQPLFVATFREYGMPRAIRTDNGAPFASTGLGGLSALSVWWVRLGLELERIEPGCPQQNGRHERMHRTLKAATAQPPQANLRQQQKAFDEFRHEYNQERPHEALGQRPPAEVYQPARRDYPSRLPEQRGYPDGWQKRRVQSTGQIKWKGHDLFLSHALAGQEIGLQPVDEGQWKIHFEHLELGHFDERKRRLKPKTHLHRNAPSHDHPNSPNL
jgi:transposase InsO family protein